MDRLFQTLSLIDIHKDLVRNIPSLIKNENLFDDLSDSPKDWVTAEQVETEIKPRDCNSKTPLINKPFENSQWDNAIN